MSGRGEEVRDPYAPPPPSSPPPHPPGRPGPPEEPAGRSNRPVLTGGKRALALAVAGAFLLLPLLPLGFLLALAGLVLGARALHAAGRDGGSAPGAVPAVVIGALASTVGGLLLAVAVWLLPELGAYRDCVGGANTVLARQACWAQFEQGYRDKLLG